MTVLAFVMCLVQVHARWACSAPGPAQMPLHWSNSLHSTAPDGSTQLVVTANLRTGNNASPVVLRECRLNTTWPLFILTRRADAYWKDAGATASRLLVPL